MRVFEVVNEEGYDVVNRFNETAREMRVKLAACGLLKQQPVCVIISVLEKL